MDETTGRMRTDEMRAGQSYQPENDPELLQAQIAQTRREMSETIDQIQQRLAPERLKREVEETVQQVTQQAQTAVRDATIGKVEKMKDRATHTASNWRMQMMDTIRRNPVPAAMIGLGLGWLMVESRSEGDDAMYGQPYTTMGTRGQMGMEEPSTMGRMQRQTEHMGSEISDTAHEMQQRAQETGEQMQQRMQETGERMQQTGEQMQQHARQTAEEVRMRAEQFQMEATERAEQMRYQLQERSEEIRQNMEQMMNENPLAMTAAALALGLGVGLLMPSTRTEDELMGQYRDQVMEQAQHKAEETMSQVRTVAQEAQRATKDAVKDVQKETQQAVDEVKHRTEEEARRQNMPGT